MTNCTYTGVIKIGPCLHHSVLYFGETSMCLCCIISSNIRYVKNIPKKLMTKLKGKQKRMVLFIRAEVYHYVLLDKSQTKIVMSIYSTHVFSNFRVWYMLHECSRKPAIFEKFYFYQKKVVLVSFFQNRFYNAVFTFYLFMNLQRQNVNKVTVTYVTDFSVKSFWKLLPWNYELFG